MFKSMCPECRGKKSRKAEVCINCRRKTYKFKNHLTKAQMIESQIEVTKNESKKKD